VTVVKSSTV